MSVKNEFGQPIGESVTGWCERPLPSKTTFEGTYCRLEPLSAARHAQDLYHAFAQAADDSDWTYIALGPYKSYQEYHKFAEQAEQSQDPCHYAVIDLKSGKAVGSLALMRQDSKNGAIEVGYVTFSRQLKQTPLSTEAHFLLMQYAFEQLGYRRYEWKCDSLNAPSRNAALRLGFQFEGIFRQAVVYKGRSRDTAWFSIIDSEWSLTKQAFQHWLAAGNFDAQGKQCTALADLRQQLTANQ